MSDEFLVTCPYCGEQVEIYVEPDVRGSFVQDCEVCCNPWRVHVSGRGDDRIVQVMRADGREGEPLASNDDSGGTLNSLLQFKAEAAGDYIVRVTSFAANGRGRYRLRVSE